MSDDIRRGDEPQGTAMAKAAADMVGIDPRLAALFGAPGKKIADDLARVDDVDARTKKAAKDAEAARLAQEAKDAAKAKALATEASAKAAKEDRFAAEIAMAATEAEAGKLAEAKARLSQLLSEDATHPGLKNALKDLEAKSLLIWSAHYQSVLTFAASAAKAGQYDAAEAELVKMLANNELGYEKFFIEARTLLADVRKTKAEAQRKAQEALAAEAVVVAVETDVQAGKFADAEKRLTDLWFSGNRHFDEPTLNSKIQAVHQAAEIKKLKDQAEADRLEKERVAKEAEAKRLADEHKAMAVEDKITAAFAEAEKANDEGQYGEADQRLKALWVFLEQQQVPEFRKRQASYQSLLRAARHIRDGGDLMYARKLVESAICGPREQYLDWVTAAEEARAKEAAEAARLETERVAKEAAVLKAAVTPKSHEETFLDALGILEEYIRSIEGKEDISALLMYYHALKARQFHEAGRVFIKYLSGEDENRHHVTTPALRKARSVAREFADASSNHLMSTYDQAVLLKVVDVIVHMLDSGVHDLNEIALVCLQAGNSNPLNPEVVRLREEIERRRSPTPIPHELDHGTPPQPVPAIAAPAKVAETEAIPFWLLVVLLGGFAFAVTWLVF